MGKEYEIADMFFDFCRNREMKTNQAIKWKDFFDVFSEKLNSTEFTIMGGAIAKLCQKGYIKLEMALDNKTQFIRLSEFGYHYMHDDNSVLDLSVPIKIIPVGMDKTSYEAFNTIWKWVGVENAPLYLKGSELYKLVLNVDNNLPPTYQLFLDERRNKGKSTTRRIWLYDIYKTLSKEQKKQFFENVDALLNEILTTIQTTNDNNNQNIIDDFFEDTFSANETKLEISKEQQTSEERHPKVFISYSWDSEEHKNWVLMLAKRLEDKGINVSIDQNDLRLGDELTNYMENSIKDVDRVLIIGTPGYYERATKRMKGVGFEYSLISAELKNALKTNRFIPILRSGLMEESFPLLLQNRMGVFMDDDNKFEDGLEKLVHDIYDDFNNKV
ncbi:MAG: toll/interleukin-1 receptor domain-containing protein [Prevotella sp.]|nr:toll/interleukin-1 receptor domain-containing protein [Prevotella sp.]